MSTITVVKDPEVLFLCTDSRFVIGSIPIGDQQKIFQVCPGVFLAASGRQSACDHQVRRAREIAAELDTTDVRRIAAAVQAEMMPFLEGMAARLRAEDYEDPMTAAHLSGAALLHGAVICGTSEGTLGYVDQSYRLVGDGLVCMAHENFLPGRQITCTTGGTLELLNATLSRFASQPAIWSDPAEVIARRLLTALKDANDLSGGPDQILRLDRDGGAEWICRPPTEAGPLPLMATATVTALVSLNSPAISGGTIVGATLTLTANGMTTRINNTVPGSGPFNAGAGIYMTRTSDGAFSAVTPIEAAIVHPSGVGFAILARSLSGVQDYGYLRLQQHGTSGAALLEATGLLTLTASGGTWGSLSANRLTLNGNIVVQGRQIGPGNPSFASVADAQAWCQNLLTALRTHGLVT
jgi:hypothetical protein